MNKTCRRCGQAFPLTSDHFYPRKSAASGFYAYCIQCHRILVKENHDANLDAIRTRQKKYYRQNQERLRKESVDRYRKAVAADPDGHRAKRHMRYVENREKKASADRIYHQKNKEKRNAYTREYYRANKQQLIEKDRIYKRNRIRENESIRMFVNLRRRMNTALRENYQRGKMIELLGCTVTELKDHLQSQFLPGMSWGNYSRTGWHIDHIIPCAAFDLSDRDQQRICFNFKNLRPLWAKDNLRKGGKPDATIHNHGYENHG